MFQKQAQVVGAIPALTIQFQLTLRAMVDQLCQHRQGDGKDSTEALKSIQSLLDQPASWERCYEAEQRIVHHFGPTMLRDEFARRLVEASDVLSHRVLEHYRNSAREARSDEQIRVLLSRLVNDLQWRYTVGEMRRQFMREITSKTGWLMILVAVPFVLVALAPDRLGTQLLLVAAVAGAFGATFSMLIGLRGRLQKSSFDDLKLARTNALIVSRVVIGAAAATILYFFIRSGLVNGAAFPELPTGASVDAGPFSHLVVWCFVAGFSEKLVPSLLSQVEGRAGSAPREEHQSLPPTDSVGPMRPDPTRQPPVDLERTPASGVARSHEVTPTTAKIA